MSTSHKTRMIAAIVATSLLQLWSSADAQTASPAGKDAPATSKAAGAHKDMGAMHSDDMKKSMENMSKQMTSTPMTGDADRDFATMMRIHHQGAIDMAQAELATGKDPQMRKLAKEIIAAQKKEIALIDRWLKKMKE